MTGNNNNVVVIVGGVIFCFVVAACVAVFIAAPEGANTGSLVAILIGSLAPTLASLGVLAKVNKVERDTHALTNGLLDSKFRAGFADVAHPSFIRPDAVPLIEKDRQRRSEAHDGPDNPPETGRQT